MRRCLTSRPELCYLDIPIPALDPVSDSHKSEPSLNLPMPESISEFIIITCWLVHDWQLVSKDINYYVLRLFVARLI